MLIRVDALEGLVRDIFRASGCSEEESKRIALYLVRANLAGHDSHGVIRVPRYVDLVRAGQLVPDQKLNVLTESDAMAIVDGQYGFGQTVGPLAVELGLKKAKQNGIALIGLRHSGHLGRIGEWAEMAAASGVVSIHFVNVAGSLLVAPFGGVDRRISTAPVTIGIPMAGREPTILDFATSAVAEGKVLVASQGGKAVPAGSLIEADGRLSTDPQTLYGLQRGKSPLKLARYIWRRIRYGNQKGALRAFGEHKGSGLALMCELLAGALTGSGCAGPGERRFSNGMLSIYLSPGQIDPENAFYREAESYLDFVKSSRPAVKGGEVLLPGEPERRTREQRLASGIPLSADTWQALAAAARQTGVDPEPYRPRSA